MHAWLLLIALTVAAARLRIRNYFSAKAYAASARHRADGPYAPAVFEVRQVVRLGNGCDLYSLNGREVFVYGVA